LLYDFESHRARHAKSAQPRSEPVKATHPFSHRPLFEFCASIPRTQLCRAGRRRDLMRRAFTGLLPAAIRDRTTKAIGQAAMDLGIREVAPALLRSPAGLLTESLGWADGP